MSFLSGRGRSNAGARPQRNRVRNARTVKVRQRHGRDHTAADAREPLCSRKTTRLDGWHRPRISLLSLAVFLEAVVNLLRRQCLLALLALPLTLPSLPARAHPRPKTSTVPDRADVHVYLMRGLFGVFSEGMDDLAGKLTANGYSADIFPWDQWQQVLSLAVQRYESARPNTVVLVGHSLGANAVFSVADGLQHQAIPIYLAVTFDATQPSPVPANVANFVNVWARDGFGTPVQAPPGYRGNLQNFDLSGQPGVDHQSIDRLDQFHQLILSQLDELTNQVS